MRHRLIAIGTIVLSLVFSSWAVVRAQHTAAPGQQKTTVIFVCEHGAAQSVIAA
jgi:hypothetical protein